MVRFLFIWLGFLMSISSAQGAPNPEMYVVDQMRAFFQDEIKEFEAADFKKQSVFQKASFRFFDSKMRVAHIDQLDTIDVGYSPQLRQILRDVYIPALDRIFNSKGVRPSQSAHDAFVNGQKAKLAVYEAAIKVKYQKIKAKHPGIRRALQLLALSRSETMADGTIGDINPASRKAIQESSTRGLYQSLMKVDDLLDKPVNMETITKLQAPLVGEAAHVNSQPGRVNDITFTNKKTGVKTHVKTYLSEVIKKINSKKPDLTHALASYGDFLHLHPMGDANGRTAEIIKLMLLEQADLPPTITREKTAMENFFYQKKFGAGYDVPDEAIAQLKETEQILDSLAAQLEGKNIVKVELMGANVVIQASEGARQDMILLTRAYEIPVDIELPPVKGAPVLGGSTTTNDLFMKTSHNGWKSAVKPSARVEATRMAGPRVNYPMYVLKDVKPNQDLEFLYYYTHENGQTIWFKNGDVNYAIEPVADNCLTKMSGNIARPL